MPKPPWECWINSIDADACGNRWNTDGSMAASMRMPQGRRVSDDGLVVAYNATSARRDARKLPAVGDSKWPLWKDLHSDPTLPVGGRNWLP